MAGNASKINKRGVHYKLIKRLKSDVFNTRIMMPAWSTTPLVCLSFKLVQSLYGHAWFQTLENRKHCILHILLIQDKKALL